jgi:hypothetical protein
MPMNTNLIKHGLDDEFYELACPTVGTLMLANFSTPDKHNSIVYGADGLFFSTYRSNRMYLRPAFPNEFDIFTSIEDFNERPTLWVLVTQMSPGYHERTPRWRGHAFWAGKNTETDQAVAKVVMQMSERGGLSLSEWYGYVLDQRVRKNDAEYKRSKRADSPEVIN